MSEEWRPVVGYEGLYEVSDLGGVIQVGPGNVKRGTWENRLPRVVATYLRNGYPRVRVRDLTGKVSQKSVHTLVAESFLGPKPSPDAVVRHLDGTRDNNTADNLMWGTPKENSRDRKDHGRDPNLNKTHCPHGHMYDKSNTYRAPSTGHRQCVACMKKRGSERATIRNEIRKRGLPDGSPRHGSEAGYKHNGCRCDLCKEAYRDAYQRRKHA